MSSSVIKGIKTEGNSGVEKAIAILLGLFLFKSEIECRTVYCFNFSRKIVTVGTLLNWDTYFSD